MLPSSGQARRGRTLRIPPGPKGSNGKEAFLGAAGLLSGHFLPSIPLYGKISNMTTLRWILFLAAIAAGIGLGLLIGWVLSPVEYVDTTPDALRSDFQTDYTLMVAEIYSLEGSAEFAVRRLALLGSSQPQEIVNRAVQFARDSGYSPDDVILLQNLQLALQTWQPTGGQP